MFIALIGLMAISKCNIAYDYSGRMFIEVNMTNSAEKASKNIEAMSVLRNYVAQVLSKDRTQEGKIEELYSLIRENIKYESDVNKNTGYSGLVEGKTACHGFAVITTKACRMLGIPCEYVYGSAGNGFHGWNRVNINGKSMYLDCSTEGKYLNEELFGGYNIIKKVGW